MFWSLLIIACSDPPQNGKDVVLTTQKHSSPSDDDFENKSFHCCDQPEATELIEHYLALTKAMAADNDSQTKVAVNALHQHTSSSEFISFSKDESLQEIVEASKYWLTLSREDIQQDFEIASKVLVDFAKKHASDKGIQLITAFCPMAPGRWLQTEPIISNPYYGSKMLTCGVFE